MHKTRYCLQSSGCRLGTATPLSLHRPAQLQQRTLWLGREEVVSAGGWRESEAFSGPSTVINPTPTPDFSSPQLYTLRLRFPMLQLHSS